MVGILILSMISHNVFAHSFYKTKTSVFFTLLKQYQVEDDLASVSLATNNSVALQHSQNAARLLKQLVSFNNDINKNSNFSNYDNIFAGLALTTKALVAANLADECLKEYGLAIGLDSTTASGLTNMSMGMIMNMYSLADKNLTDGNIAQSSESSAPQYANNQSFGELFNLTNNRSNTQVNYESSTMLAKSLKQLFSDNLQNSVLENSTGLMRIPMNMKIDSVNSLGEGIDNLILALNTNAPLEQVFSIVHGQIHPNLHLAYNLKLKGE